LVGLAGFSGLARYRIAVTTEQRTYMLKILIAFKVYNIDSKS
jgi:hypothetical protein